MKPLRLPLGRLLLKGPGVPDLGFAGQSPVGVFRGFPRLKPFLDGAPVELLPCEGRIGPVHDFKLPFSQTVLPDIKQPTCQVRRNSGYPLEF